MISSWSGGGTGFLFCIGMYFYRLITYTRRQRQIDELDRRTNEQLRWDLAAAERQFEAEYEDAVSSYRSSVAQTADRFYSEAQETGSLPPAASWLEDLLGTAIQAAPRSRSLEWISPQMTFTVHPAKITARLRPSPGITPDWDEETDREWAEKEYEYNFKNQQERSPITATDPDGRAVQCAAYASLLARVLHMRFLENMCLGAAAVGYRTESLHGAGSPQAQRIMIARQGGIQEKKKLAKNIAGISSK